MRITQLVSIVAISMVIMSCAPIVSGNSKEKNLFISGTCAKKGDGTYVQILIGLASSDIPLKVEFIGPQPEEVTIETTPGSSSVRWKLGKDHIMAIGIKPYELLITSGENVYKAYINFGTAGGMFIGGVIQVVIGAVVRIH